MRRIQDFVERDTLLSICDALVQPHFNYCSEVWDSLGQGYSNKLQKLHNRSAHLIMNLSYDTPVIEALNALGCLTDVFCSKKNTTHYNLRGSSTSLQIIWLLPNTEAYM